MSAATLVERAALDGVELRMMNGELKVLGERAAVERWLPSIREQKADVLALLTLQPKAHPYVIRLRLTLEAEDGRRTEAILEVPRDRLDGERVLALFEKHRMAGTTRVVSVKQEASDDRHHCRDCARLRNGICTAADDIGAQAGYRPADDLPRRCDGFEEAGSYPCRLRDDRAHD